MIGILDDLAVHCHSPRVNPASRLGPRTHSGLRQYTLQRLQRSLLHRFFILAIRGLSSPRRGGDLRDLSIIKDGAVLIENGVILEVGPSRRLERLADARSIRE